MNVLQPTLRELTPAEIHLIAGGGDEDIIVIGSRITYSGLDSGGSSTGGGGLNHPEDDADSITPADPTPTATPVPYQDCAKDNKALAIGTTIRAQNVTSVEQGAGLFTKPDGSIGSSTIQNGFVDANGDLKINIAFPAGTNLIDVLGTIHSHPARATTGDPAADQRAAVADQYPSPDDWANLSVLAARMSELGGNPSQLSLYIVSPSGEIREFNWDDRHIYDVPVDQLLQKPGQPPLPPLPQPITAPRTCGS